MMVYALGGGNERLGFKYFAIIVAALFVIFIILTCAFVKEQTSVNMQTAGIGQMFKALIQNDQAMCVVVAIVLINCAVYITSNLVIYFFKYDFGGSAWYSSYTYFNIFGGAIQILAMMIFFPVLRRFLTTIKIFYICIASAIAGYIILLVMAFTNMSSVFLLFIPAFFIFAANGMLQVIVTIFLADTVDYGELKNKRRDESVIFSMQTFVVKLASGIAAFIASICLSVFNLSSDSAEEAIDFSAAVSASSKVGLRMTMTILPIIGLFIGLFWFKKKFILTEDKMKEIGSELEKERAQA